MTFFLNQPVVHFQTLFWHEIFYDKNLIEQLWHGPLNIYVQFQKKLKKIFFCKHLNTSAGLKTKLVLKIFYLLLKSRIISDSNVMFLEIIILNLFVSKS